MAEFEIASVLFWFEPWVVKVNALRFIGYFNH